MHRLQIHNLIRLLNILDLLGICFITLIAFIFQFLLNELPCPLCLLQRLSIIAIGFGFALNIHYQIRPAHYALSLLAAVFTGFVSLRQITLHILPNDAGYGNILFGWHLYTWVFVLSIVAIIYTAIMLSIPAQYSRGQLTVKITEMRSKSIKILGHLAFGFLLLLLIANVISTFMECGFETCPDNPITYRLKLIH